MLPLTAGILIAGPVSGYLSDRFGARPFATGGMLGVALSFLLLMLLPVDFSYRGLRSWSCSSTGCRWASSLLPTARAS